MAQTLIYGLMILSAIFTCAACGAHSTETAPATANSAASADKDSEKADNDKGGEATQKAITAESREKAAAKRGDCATWQDVKAAAKAKKIGVSSGEIPELPEGFRNGCVYSNMGAHTLRKERFFKPLEHKILRSSENFIAFTENFKQNAPDNKIYVIFCALL